MLQKTDPEGRNCLHRSCKTGSFEIVKIITEVCEDLTQKLKQRKNIGDLDGLDIELETPFDKDNILLGIMSQKDRLQYVPFFMLCK